MYAAPLRGGPICGATPRENSPPGCHRCRGPYSSRGRACRTAGTAGILCIIITVRDLHPPELDHGRDINIDRSRIAFPKTLFKDVNAFKVISYLGKEVNA